jgi:hypothetical protein
MENSCVSELPSPPNGVAFGEKRKMKSPQQASTDSGIDVKLIRAVVRQLGDRSYLEDIVNHGADAGYPGFVYYNETTPFWKRNRKEITALVMSMAQDLGEQPAEMVAKFNCLKIESSDFEAIQDVYSALGNGQPSDDSTVPNALAWFALEEVARAMVEEG